MSKKLNEKKKVNIAVMVSGGGTNLQALIDSKVIKNGIIKLVLSNNEDAYALERAKKNNIATYVITKKSHQDNFEQSMIDILKKRLTSMNIELSLTDDAKNFIFEKGYDTQYGARPLKRAIQNYIEDTLSEGMLMGNIKEHQKVLLDTKADKTGLQIVSDILANK